MRGACEQQDAAHRLIRGAQQALPQCGQIVAFNPHLAQEKPFIDGVENGTANRHSNQSLIHCESLPRIDDLVDAFGRCFGQGFAFRPTLWGPLCFNGED